MTTSVYPDTPTPRRYNVLPPFHPSTPSLHQADSDGYSSNILSLPFRKSTQLSLASSIRQYISKKYDQHPDMFRHDLEVIDHLRRDAVNSRDAHPSGIKKLQTYAGQLVGMNGKFPVDVRTPAIHSAFSASVD